MSKFITAIFTVLFLFVAGCSKSPRDQLIGKWKEDVDHLMFVEFFEDGTCRNGSKEFPDAYLTKIHWALLDDSYLKLDFTESSGKSGSITNEISFVDDRMIVIDHMHSITAEYIRVK